MGLDGVNPNVLLAAGLALAAFVLLRKTKGWFSSALQSSRECAPSNCRSEGLLRDRPSAEPPIELLRWQVEMHETARDLKAEIDTKLVALQVVTQLAREERQQLESALAHARRLGLGRSDPLAAIENLADNPSAAAELPPFCAGQSLPLDRQQAARAAEFLAAGLSTARIAEKLSVPVGDVELALQLSVNSATPETTT